MQLISRLVGRHELLLLNFYPYLCKYLLPHQREVTTVLSALAQACHAVVPPSELQQPIQLIIRNFITEAQTPEVIQVGLNAVREICLRTPLALEEAQLTDLSDFRKHKTKGVASAARALINYYREENPEMLHRSLRGKEASMALSHGEVKPMVYGEVRGVSDGLLPGIQFLTKRIKGTTEGEEGSEGSGTEDEDGEVDDEDDDDESG